MVLVFIDHADGHIKKTSFEAASYAAAVAKQLGTSAEAILLGTVNDDVASLETTVSQKCTRLQMQR
jgi:electron transfer flavoprotein alpha subunit